MRVFALSDVHVDFEENRQWVDKLSKFDYRSDVLILAGDVTDSLKRLEWCLHAFASRFKTVLYVPGNHDLWVLRSKDVPHSLMKFSRVCDVAQNCQVHIKPVHYESLSIVPLYGWYDYSFGKPTDDLLSCWMDYRACKWPADFGVEEITAHFLEFNEDALQTKNQTVISFSHFLPRIDVMPAYIPANKRFLYPVLGTAKLEDQIRRLNPRVHVYGHSHVNRHVEIDGVLYVNNAFGYPQEARIAAKQLLSIFEM
jgi:predicted phosphodiesterase